MTLQGICANPCNPWSKAALSDMPDDSEITETIIGAAYTVLNKLKPGLDEKLHERALIIQPGKQGLACEDQKMTFRK